jgi:hypothetical protein
MDSNYRMASILLFTVLLITSIVPTTVSGNIEKTYRVQVSSGISHQYDIFNIQPRLFSGLHNQKLYVSIPASLVNYYGNLTHTVNDDADYAQFVTPQAVTPIAECLLKVTDNLPDSNEQFADAVLALVHQIPYNVTDPKYPVETLTDNMGDCVGLSILAASIMEAGGLNVVLIHYVSVNPQHMNVGVYLPYTPVYHTPLISPTSFTYDNKTYWTAECTAASNWKVGDQSPSLANAKAVIIPLNNTQTFVPAQVSASLNSKLLSSTITVDPSQQVNSSEADGERAITISGSIIPAIPGQTVNIYISGNVNGASEYYGDYTPGIQSLTAVTDNSGNYSLTWNFTTSGTYYITASWNGVSNYAGADSQTLQVFVGPQSFVQFNAQSFNYIFGQEGLAALATAPMQGTSDFITLPLGANASLSYSFVILNAGKTISNVQTTNVTVPASRERLMMPNGTLQTVLIAAYNETIPVSVPIGLVPLRLPDDFNQTLDNQFCFILENNAGNYSLEIKGLSEDDVSNIQPNVLVTNATANVQEDTWYQVTTNINDNLASTSLSDANGTLISSMSGNQTVLLVTNNEDTAIVLKNLTVQTHNGNSLQTQNTPKTTSNPANSITPLLVVMSILLAASITAALYVRKQRKIQSQTRIKQTTK